MTAGLVSHALRRYPWSFVGPFVTVVLGTTIISACFMTLTSVASAHLSAPARRALEAGGLVEAAIVFLLISVYVSIPIIGVTMGAAISRQVREVALLRAVGATPGQVRRMIAAQAAIAAVPAATAGACLGALAGRQWVATLIQHGIVPPDVHFRVDIRAWPLVLGCAVVTSLIGAAAAAVRPSRVRVAASLTESLVARSGVGVVRATLGVAAVAGGVVLSWELSHADPSTAGSATVLVLLAMSVGVGLLGPAALVVLAAALHLPLRLLLGQSALLATDNVRDMSRALAAALVPLVLAIGFAVVKIAVHTTASHMTGQAAAASDVWLDYSGTAIYVTFAAVAAVNTLITVAVRRRDDLRIVRLAGASRGRVLYILSCESLVVVAATLLLAAAVAAATLLPLLHATLHTWRPVLPARTAMIGAFSVLATVAASTLIPSRLQMPGAVLRHTDRA